MKLLALVLAVAGCSSKTETDKAPDKSSDKAKPPTSGPSDKASISGDLTVSGDMTGTFQWKPDLALDCTWITSSKIGRISVTMTDGHDGFLALDILTGSDNANINMTSGRLKSAGRVESKAGYTLTGTSDGTMTATIDGDLVGREAKVHLKGTLEARCTVF